MRAGSPRGARGGPGTFGAARPPRPAAGHLFPGGPWPGRVGAESPPVRAGRRVDRVAAAGHAAGRAPGGDRMTPVIETRELSKRYRGVAALSDCTITVPEGRIAALIGPYGARKPNHGNRHFILPS